MKLQPSAMLLSLLALAACDHTAPVVDVAPTLAVETTSVLLTPAGTPAPISMGFVILSKDAQRLDAQLASGGGATGRRVAARWTSSDPAIAQVTTTNGVAEVRFAAPGDVTLSAVYGDGASAWRGGMSFVVSAAKQ